MGGLIPLLTLHFANGCPNQPPQVDIEVIHTPFQAPNANAFAERWVRSVREECLNQLLILRERQLRTVLREYVDYSNTRRPHQGLAQQCPVPMTLVRKTGVIACNDVLGGLIHDYRRVAA